MSGALILLLFAVFVRAPFRVEGDVAYVTKAAQQYVAGLSGFNQIRLADPADFSRDVQTWIYWWPPAIFAAMALCLRAGLSVGGSARVLMLLCALSGAIGWAFVAVRIFSSRRAIVVASLVPMLYVVSIGMFAVFMVGDTLVFGITPWLFVLTLTVWRDNTSPTPPTWRLPATCFVLGAIYWIKYSSILSTGALAAFLCITALRRRFSRRTIGLVAASAAAFIAPVAALYLVNQRLGGDIVQTHLQLAAAYQSPLTGLSDVLASAILPVHAGILRIARSGLNEWIGIALGWALLVVTLRCATRRFGTETGLLSLLVLLMPLPGLAYLQATGGFGFLADAARHCGPYWIWLQLLLVGILIDNWPAPTSSDLAIRRVAAGLTVIMLAFALYTPWVTLRNTSVALHADADRPTGLFYPTLSGTNSARIISDIRATLGPDDVAVPATYWLGMETWLALPGRVMPLTNFFHPLIRTHGKGGADYYATSPLRTTRQTRVLLIAEDPYGELDAPANVEAIKKRFNASGGWTELKSYPADRVQIWASVVAPGEPISASGPSN